VPQGAFVAHYECEGEGLRQSRTVDVPGPNHSSCSSSLHLLSRDFSYTKLTLEYQQALATAVAVGAGMSGLYLAWITYLDIRADETLDLSMVADQLALAVGKQWQAEAFERRWALHTSYRSAGRPAGAVNFLQQRVPDRWRT
jgi:hypothetical protein